MKFKIIAALFLILALGGLVLFFFIKKLQGSLVEAEAEIARLEAVEAELANFGDMQVKLQKESSRCESFTSQDEGNFDEFEYCRRFLEFYNTFGLD